MIISIYCSEAETIHIWTKQNFTIGTKFPAENIQPFWDHDLRREIQGPYSNSVIEFAVISLSYQKFSLF